MTELSTKIKALEDARGKANEKMRLAREAVGGYHEQRDRISSEKSELEEELTVINKAVETKKDALQRLKMAFVVASEEALNQQVCQSCIRMSKIMYLYLLGSW